MSINTKCLICGREFTTNRPNKKYCSFSCKEAGRKLTLLKWKDRNPEYYKKYMQERRKKERVNNG